RFCFWRRAPALRASRRRSAPMYPPLRDDTGADRRREDGRGAPRRSDRRRLGSGEPGGGRGRRRASPRHREPLHQGPGRAHAGEEHLARAESILSVVGTVARVPEGLLDAVTGLSGSGPAYVFLVAEALIEAGLHAGLPRPISQALVIQTLLGSATLLAQGSDG